MKSILFIGNSFTFANDLPVMFEKLACDAGFELKADSVMVGGAYLHEFAAPEHEYGKKLAEKCKEGSFDYVVLQDQSFNPAGDRADFLRASKTLCEMFKNSEKIFFYQTWAYKDGGEMLKSVGLSYKEMYEQLRDSYLEGAKQNNGVCVPVGGAFALANQNCPEIELYTSDSYHPSAAGTYLAACVFYAFVSGRSPLELSGSEKIDAETAVKLREVADKLR